MLPHWVNGLPGLGGMFSYVSLGQNRNVRGPLNVDVFLSIIITIMTLYYVISLNVHSLLPTKCQAGGISPGGQHQGVHLQPPVPLSCMVELRRKENSANHFMHPQPTPFPFLSAPSHLFPLIKTSPRKAVLHTDALLNTLNWTWGFLMCHHSNA